MQPRACMSKSIARPSAVHLMRTGRDQSPGPRGRWRVQKNTRAEGPARAAKKTETTGEEAYDARAAGRRGAAATTVTAAALTGFAILARDAVRAMLRALTTKHFSSA